MHFYEQILLRPDAFARGSIVIRARLLVNRRVHRVPFRLDNLPEFFQRVELPSHETIVEWIHIGRNERPSPIDLTS